MIQVGRLTVLPLLNGRMVSCSMQRKPKDASSTRLTERVNRVSGTLSDGSCGYSSLAVGAA